MAESLETMKRYKVATPHYNLLTTKLGLLQPTSCFEANPGETIQMSTSALIRVDPLVTPVMHPVSVIIHTWQIPMRTLWDGFEEFITGGEDGLNNDTPPQASSVTVSEGDVIESMGVKPGTGRTYTRFAPLAYARTWNKRYRDQQLQSEIDESTYNGNVAPKNVNWERDYFTASRPSPVLGAQATLPLGTKAPVATDVAAQGNEYTIYSTSLSGYRYQDASATTLRLGGSGGNEANSMYADLQNATGASINDVRTMFAVQRWQEARNLYGARFTEYLRSIGVRSSDARLQDPEYLGGGKQTVSFSEVLNVSSATGADAVGTMRGHGIAAIKTRPFRRFIEEHSMILTVMAVRPKAIYMDGQHKMFDRLTKFDFWQKELQNVGLSPIKNKEIKVDHASPDGTFGWNDNYASYNHIPSRISGEFRSTEDVWHFGRDLSASDPALNDSFISCVPARRMFHNTADTDKLKCMVNHSVRRRTMVNPRPNQRII